MGYTPSAELVWGIQLSAYDADGNPTRWWDESTEDWVDLAVRQLTLDGVSDPSGEVPREIWHGYGTDGAFNAWKAEHPDWQERRDAYRETKREVEKNLRVKIVTYGHYEDPESRAILTPSDLERYSGDAWTPGRVSDLPNPGMDRDKALSKGTDTLRSLGFDESFYGGDTGWWLVASYG